MRQNTASLSIPQPSGVNRREKYGSIGLHFIKKHFENSLPSHLTVSNKLSLKLETESPATNSLSFTYFCHVFFLHNKVTVPLQIFFRIRVIIFCETLEIAVKYKLASE